MLVLVRLIGPASYGEFSMVTTIIGFLNVFTSVNFVAHIIQVREETETRYQEHFTASLYLQLTAFLLTNAVALALRYSETYLPITPYLHVMSVLFLLTWPHNLREKMLERSFSWQRLRILHAIGLAAGAVLGIIMAWLGCGTYALLVPGLLVTLPFIWDLFVSEKWRPTWAWSWDNYKPVFHFAMARTGSGLVLNGRQLLEVSALTAIFGFTSLGVFSRSLGLAQLFCGKISSQLVGAIYPLLTRIEEKDGNTARVSDLLIQAVAWITIPMATTMAVLAKPAVALMYGDRWLVVVPLVPWAMAWGVTSALFQTTYMLLLARNHQRKCLVADIALFVGTGLALLVALPFGITAYLIAANGVVMVTWFLLLVWLTRMGALTLKGLAGSLGSGVLAAGIAGCFATWGGQMTGISETTSPLNAAVWGIVFFISYLAVLRILFVGLLDRLVSYLPMCGTIRQILLVK